MKMPEKDILFIGIKREINEDFRKAIGLKFGYGRKFLRIGVEEALSEWTEKINKENGK